MVLQQLLKQNLELDVQEEVIPFATITRGEPDQLPKGQSRVVTEGINGRISRLYSVTTDCRRN